MDDRLPDVTDAVAYDSETNTYRASFDSTTTDPSTAVVTVLANVMEKRSTDLSPLYYAVDPNALDQLFKEGSTGDCDSDRELVFTYEDHTVTVISCGIIKAQSEETTIEDVES